MSPKISSKRRIHTFLTLIRLEWSFFDSLSILAKQKSHRSAGEQKKTFIFQYFSTKLNTGITNMIFILDQIHR